MALIKLYAIDGKTNGTLEVSDQLFATKGSKSLVHEALIAHEANNRVQYAHVKDRSEVSGGGKKPWKQKGTGRARHGSSRSPIWKGGGVTFGPNALQDFSVKLNKRAKKKALALVLSDKLAGDKIAALTNYELPEAKAKHVSAMRKALPGSGRSTLVITLPTDKAFITAAQNVAKTDTIFAGSLNVRDLLSHEYVIVSEAAVKTMTDLYTR
jgi:large subunit ribosomal protein L4